MQHPLRQGSQTNKNSETGEHKLTIQTKYENISVKQKQNKIKINQNKTRAEKHEIKALLEKEIKSKRRNFVLL